MQGVRGADKQPSEVGRTQNWIGGNRPGDAAFVPPLVRAGLLHVQFETIHPYLDGNGRIGRLLVTLLLEHWKLLTKPLLYLRLFFMRHRSDYYGRLGAVRTNGDWEARTDSFLDGVATIADEAVTSARELFTLVTDDRSRTLDHAGTELKTPGRP